jgi:hypothetical protein
MSGQSRRTWQKHSVGQILFTVQLDPLGEELSIERHRRLVDVTRWLVELFSSHRLPATWASGNPAQCAATRPVTQSSVDHELAILGDESWTGEAAGRSGFARELSRRVGLARSTGLNVTSLVAWAATIHPHVDVVIKHGISAVARASHELNLAPAATPRALHYGLWELPITERLPLRKTWLPGARRKFLRRIRFAAENAATAHIFISAAGVEQEGARSEATIIRTVRKAAELRDRGLARIETLTKAAARLADVPLASPQRSILRRAA